MTDRRSREDAGRNRHAAAAIPCELHLCGDSPHIRHVVTGFYELAAQGIINLRITGRPRYESSEWLDPLSLRAVIAGRRVAYDLSDGWYIPLELRRHLPSADHYFKRALDPARLDDMPATVTVWPLGLNYLVTSARNLWHRGLCPFVPRRIVAEAARRASTVGGRFGVRDVREMTIEDLEMPPTPGLEPRVLFMCRAWDAAKTGDSAYLRADRESVNELRAQCIRAARAEFGDRFYGGFAIDEFTRREYGDCLLPDRKSSERQAFREHVRTSAICVATSGLHRSIGWKMAEYVAASRAIVSEPLAYIVPGGFRAERNYLEFRSPDDFIGAIDRALRDRELRVEMMNANWAYYRHWVRPDAQVMRSLERVLDLRWDDAARAQS